MHDSGFRNIRLHSPGVKPKTAEEVQAKIQRLTGKYVARMVRAMMAYHGRTDDAGKRLPGEKRHYYEFRRNKRKLYALYPDQPAKAKAIVNFALVRSGWASRADKP